MSIRVMSWVWENGPEDRSELIVMLALADFADDAGRSFPSMRAIAAKARMTERGVQKIVQRLIEDDWLTVQTGGGMNGSNRYRILRKETAPPPEPGSPPEQDSPPERRFTTPPNGGSPKPSSNRQRGGEGDAGALAPKPVDEIAAAVMAFNAVAERIGWPQVQKLTDTRRARLRARLSDAGGIDGWHAALAKAEASDLCAGRKLAWKASFDFLLQESSFVKLLEGAYDNRPDPASQQRPSHPQGGGRPTSMASIVARRAAERAAGGSVS